MEMWGPNCTEPPSMSRPPDIVPKKFSIPHRPKGNLITLCLAIDAKMLKLPCLNRDHMSFWGEPVTSIN